jgi:hypothetical protein
MGFIINTINQLKTEKNEGDVGADYERAIE